MRMEAKNSYFKKIAQQGNFKNIALSVARRHQKLMCALLHDDDFFEKAVIKSNGTCRPQGMQLFICMYAYTSSSVPRLPFSGIKLD